MPYKIHTILPDKGIPLTTRKWDKQDWIPIFDRVCHEYHLEHRLTKVSHPRTNGQIERMNRMLKEVPVKRYDYDSHDQLKQHLATFVKIYTFAKRLKIFKGLT